MVDASILRGDRSMKSVQFPLGMLLLPMSVLLMESQVEMAFAQISKPISSRQTEGDLLSNTDRTPSNINQTDANPSAANPKAAKSADTKPSAVKASVANQSAEEPSAAERPTIDELIPLDHPSSGEAAVVTDAQGNAMIPFFGHSVRGNHIVFVIDRSMSTGGEGNLTLPLIRAQVRKALAGLGDVQRFELVLYSDAPRLYNPAGSRGKIAFANDDNKERALAFLDSVRSHGNTDHLPAMRLALELRPDVLFWLTDGDEPRLSREELDQIRAWATGIRIYTIEFGVGKEPQSPGFLKTAALENGGKYQWVDLVQALKEWRKRQP